MTARPFLPQGAVPPGKPPTFPPAPAANAPPRRKGSTARRAIPLALTSQQRRRMEIQVEWLIALLDATECDCEAEPEPDELTGDEEGSLGWTTSGHIAGAFGDDREWDTADDEPDSDSEGINAAPLSLNQDNGIFAQAVTLAHALEGRR